MVTVVGSRLSFAACIMIPDDTNNPKMVRSITNNLNALVQEAGRERGLNTKSDLMFNISPWFKVISAIYVLMTGCRPSAPAAPPPSSDFTADHVLLAYLADEGTGSMTSCLSVVQI